MLTRFASWHRMPLRYVARNVVDKGDGSAQPFIALEDIESKTGRLVPNFEWRTADSSAYACFHKGDILFGKLRPYLVKVTLPDRCGCCPTELLVLRPTPGIESEFLYYLMLSEPVIAQARATSYGVKMPRTSWEQLGQITVSIPEQNEQTLLAGCLTRETARIDELAAKHRQIAELLIERWNSVLVRAISGADCGVTPQASGLEWIERVPGHWEIAPVYAKYSVQLGKMLDTAHITGNHLRPYLRNVNVQWDRIDCDDLMEMDFTEGDRAKYALQSGDLIVCEGGDVGRAAVWQGQLTECYYQKALHRLRPVHPNEVPRFMMYVLWLAASLGVFRVEGNANTIDHLTAEKLRRHRFPFPPPEEQRAIVAALDDELARIGRLAKVVQEQLDRLSERRAALITAAVTGQIDVRGMAT